jgi:hypothetical protein
MSHVIASSGSFVVSGFGIDFIILIIRVLLLKSGGRDCAESEREMSAVQQKYV